MEAFIYAVGSIALISIAFFLIVAALTLAFTMIRSYLYEELCSVYNHTQLKMFMSMLLKEGWSKTKDKTLQPPDKESYD